MQWMLVLLGATALLAGPVVAGVVAPGLLTQAAEGGLAVGHRHFVFDEDITVRHGERVYLVHVADGDLYEMPLTTQLVVRGAITPAPSDADLQGAFKHALERYKLPIVGYEVQRDGEAVTVKATLPAGVLANLSPAYRAHLEKYEA